MSAPAAPRRLFGFLFSIVPLVWLAAGWIIYYVLLSIWTGEAFARFIGGLETSLFMKVPFVAFLASGFLNLAAAARKRIGKGLAGLAPLVIPLGLMLSFTGLFVSVTGRQSQWLMVGLEHEVRPAWAAGPLRVVSIDPGIRDTFLDIEMDTGTGLFMYEPTIVLQDAAGSRFTVGAFPPAYIKGIYYHILRFGIAPGMKVIEDGVVKDEWYPPLNILRPGKKDTFEIPSWPYSFTVSLEPVRVFQKGMVKALEFSIRPPLYNIKAMKGEKVIAETVSRDGIRVGGYEIQFFEPTFWVQLEAVKDGGAVIFLSGIIIAVAGFPLALAAFIFGRRRGVSRLS